MSLDRDLSLEGTEGELHLLKPLNRIRARCPANAPQAEHGTLDVDLQVFATHPGHLEADDDLVARLEDVGSRLPTIPP